MSDNNPLLVERLLSKGPKRMLSLDGGGIRGALTLGYLEKMEEILSERHQHIIPKDKFRLHHYFDMIGGTSTGSIIAAALATGWKASDIKAKYKALGNDVFQKRKLWGLMVNPFNALSFSYHAKPLKRHLNAIFGDFKLGDSSNKTGLCVITKRINTFSTWPVTNNPAAKYFDDNRFLLKDIVRASTAAPTFFKPELIDVKTIGQRGSFVDGGVSIMNNPSLQLFMLASIKGYRLGGYDETLKDGIPWSLGPDRLLIISAGTGRRDKKLLAEHWENPSVLKVAKVIPDQFMNDASELVEAMMHVLGKFPPNYSPRKIDSELDTMAGDSWFGQKAFSYARYNIDLVKNKLISIGLTNLSDPEIERLTVMDDASNTDNLIAIGQAAAESILPGHFPPAFDLKEAAGW